MLAINKSQRGSVLISVLVISIVLLILGSIFSYRIITSTNVSAVKMRKDKTYYLASRGIEDARRYLSNNYVSTNYWSTLLSNDGSYNQINSLSFTRDNINVDVYVRDNEDWDNNYASDNDLKIYVLSIATGRRGAKTVIESLVFYDSSTNPYAQKGMGSKKTGYTSTSGIQNLSNLNQTSFKLGGK